jgi:hypothetical protein
VILAHSEGEKLKIPSGCGLTGSRCLVMGCRRGDSALL